MAHGRPPAAATRVVRRGLSILAPAGNAYLLYVSLRLLCAPGPDDAARVHDFSLLYLYELVLGPANLVMAMLPRSPWGRLAVAGALALLVWPMLGTMVEPARLTDAVAGVVAAHFLFLRPPAEPDARLRSGCLASRLMIWFFVLLAVLVLGDRLPPAGLDRDWIEASGYEAIRRVRAFPDTGPATLLWGATAFYALLVLGQVLLWFEPSSGSRRRARRDGGRTPGGTGDARP